MVVVWHVRNPMVAVGGVLLIEIFWNSVFKLNTNEKNIVDIIKSILEGDLF